MPVSSLIFVQLLIEKLGARRSYDLSDAKNATDGFMKNAREKFAFCSTKEKVVARRSCDFPPKESNVISLQSLSDTENAKAKN